jgi:hypothetical protein
MKPTSNLTAATLNRFYAGLMREQCGPNWRRTRRRELLRKIKEHQNQIAILQRQLLSFP